MRELPLPENLSCRILPAVARVLQLVGTPGPYVLVVGVLDTLQAHENLLVPAISTKSLVRVRDAHPRHKLFRVRYHHVVIVPVEPDRTLFGDFVPINEPGPKPVKE